MANSSGEYMPVAGPLRLRESVQSALYALRHLTQLTLDALDPPRTLRTAQLELSLVVLVEDALSCSLPDEILACLANHDDMLREDGFDLGKIADRTQFAWRRGCPKDLVAVGRQESNAFYCVSRKGPRDRGVQIADFDNIDGSLNWYDLGDWLAQKFEGRREFLADRYPALASWQALPMELAAFRPSLVQ